MSDRIKQVIPINLKRREDKLIAYYGAMHVTQVPHEMIKPFWAHDAADYPTAYDVREAAAKEFSFWNKLDDTWLDARWLGRGSLCCLWSMQSVLKMIAEDRDPHSLSVMSTDGVAFTRHWRHINVDIDLYLPDVDIFQLWHHDGTHPRPPHFPDPLEDFPLVSRGFGGMGDGCFVLSPYGAQMILDWSAEKPYHLLEILMYEHSFDVLPGCYSPVEYWRWCRPHIDLEAIFGRPDSERELLDNTEGTV